MTMMTIKKMIMRIYLAADLMESPASGGADNCPGFVAVSAPLVDNDCHDDCHGDVDGCDGKDGGDDGVQVSLQSQLL